MTLDFPKSLALTLGVIGTPDGRDLFFSLNLVFGSVTRWILGLWLVTHCATPEDLGLPLALAEKVTPHPALL